MNDVTSMDRGGEKPKSVVARILRFGTVAGSVVVGLLVVHFGIALILAKAQPARAYEFAAENPAAAAALANSLVRIDPTTGRIPASPQDIARAEMLSRAVLAADPTNPDALVALAKAELLQGNRAAAKAALDAAWARSMRLGELALLRIATGVEGNDVSTTSDAVISLFLRRPDSVTSIVEALLGALARYPVIVEDVAKRINADTPWAEPFIQVIARSKNDHLITVMLNSLQLGSSPQLPYARKLAASSLIDAGRLAEAARLRAATDRVPMQVQFVSMRDPHAFVWRKATGGNLGTELDGRPTVLPDAAQYGKSASIAYAGSGAPVELLHRSFTLAPGQYVLRFAFAMEEAGSRFVIRVGCDATQVLTDRSLAGAVANRDAEAALTFIVPELGCPVQRISLISPERETGNPLSLNLWMRDLRRQPDPIDRSTAQ